MKRKLPVLIAIALALIIMLTACDKNTMTLGQWDLFAPLQQSIAPTAETFLPEATEPMTEAVQPDATGPAAETTPPTVTEPMEKPGEKPATTATTTLTKDQAISKALSHAGLKKSQVSRLKAQPDIEDGVKVYEVEFETAQYEYEYEINAKTGKVRKAEKDRND